MGSRPRLRCVYFVDGGPILQTDRFAFKVASQYLVIARHALLTLHQDRGPSIATVPPREVSVGRTESTRVDSPRQSVKTKTISFSQSSKSQDDESWRLKDAI